jgi:hypothetical protein
LGIAIILAAALAWWLHKRGELLPNLALWGGVGAAALIATKLITLGRLVPGLLVAGLGYAWWRYNQQRSPEAKARALLGVAPDASAEVIQAAWRSRILAAHPDTGGSTAAAQALTEARDLLLAQARG